jgi:hypothetical protein
LKSLSKARIISTLLYKLSKFASELNKERSFYV